MTAVLTTAGILLVPFLAIVAVGGAAVWVHDTVAHACATRRRP